MDYKQLAYYLSEPRLNRFLRACNNSKVKTLGLYKLNLEVAQAFYPLINLFETFIRNAIYNKVAQQFNDNDWILTEKNRFMSDPSLSGTNFYLKNSVQKAEDNIRKSRSIVSSSKVLAEQTLGFWTSLFDNHHFILVQGSPLHAFPNKPAHVNRSQLMLRLKGIRDFRNRIYHNEPICFKGSSIDFNSALMIMREMHQVMEWISPSLKAYTDSYNTIESKVAQAENF